MHTDSSEDVVTCACPFSATPALLRHHSSSHTPRPRSKVVGHITGAGGGTAVREAQRCWTLTLWACEDGMFQAVQDRELDGRPSGATRRAVSTSLDLVGRLELQRTLDAHMGCVNTAEFDCSGRVLLTGSDDRDIMLWDWEAGARAQHWTCGMGTLLGVEV